MRALQRVGAYEPEAGGLQEALTSVAPWAGLARGKRISEQADLLLSRHSSEDLLYAVFFAIHGCELLDLAIVRHTVNPTWEKGPVQNAVEFGKMCTKCGDKIAAALGDPETKATIDLLNACDMRDQVGSYRVIVSFETPQLEEFSLCILQQNNCFECSADIWRRCACRCSGRWNGAALDAAAARQIFVGHLDHAEAHASSQRLAHSWKIVCGANPAYDAFPAQHQIFYPSTKSATSLWYDPVFKVETLDGRQVWTKRHYRCTPREVAADLRGDDGASHGAWTLSTLDNGVISKEHWTTVDAADDLSWAIFHYSGAASVVGQSYRRAALQRRRPLARGRAQRRRVRAHPRRLRGVRHRALGAVRPRPARRRRADVLHVDGRARALAGGEPAAARADRRAERAGVAQEREGASAPGGLTKIFGFGSPLAAPTRARRRGAGRARSRRAGGDCGRAAPPPPRTFGRRGASLVDERSGGSRGRPWRGRTCMCRCAASTPAENGQSPRYHHASSHAAASTSVARSGSRAIGALRQPSRGERAEEGVRVHRLVVVDKVGAPARGAGAARRARAARTIAETKVDVEPVLRRRRVAKADGEEALAHQPDDPRQVALLILAEDGRRPQRERAQPAARAAVGGEHERLGRRLRRAVLVGGVGRRRVGRRLVAEDYGLAVEDDIVGRDVDEGDAGGG